MHSSSTSHEHFSVCRDQVAECIQSFPNGSSGSLDGLTPQHLKDIFINVLEGPVKDNNLERFSKFLTLLANEPIPSEAREIFFGARLIALSKKDGGIRPIAIGNTIRRTVAKIINKRAENIVKDYLLPYQYGAGAKGGAEFIVHSSRDFINKNRHHTILKLDFSNAFNSLDRDWLLSQVEYLHVPGRFFIEQSYKYKSILSYDKNIISSERGIQQGDPLGPLLFCIAIQPIVQSLQSQCNLWYMDDGIIGDEENIVMKDFEILKRKCVEIGLSLNIKKCEIFGANNCSHDFTRIGKDNFMLLGAPLLNEGTERALNERLLEFQRLKKELSRLPTHHAFSVLKSSLGACRVMSTLRCSPCASFKILESFDEEINSAIEEVINISLTVDAAIQAHLPIKLGGLGISSVSDLSRPAYLSSFYGVQERYRCDIKDPHVPLYVREFTEMLGGASLLQNLNQQKAWCSLLHKHQLQTLKDNVSVASSSRLASCAHKYSGDWLQALPNRQMGTLLTNEEFHNAASLRLGLPIYQQHSCQCGSLVDSYGNHCFACKKNNGKILRHAMVNEVISRALKSVFCPNIQEPTNLHSHLRPDGVTTMPFRCGKSLAWDFTCPSTQVSSGALLNKGPGCLSNAKEELKRTKYEPITNNYWFCPIAIDTIGAYGTQAAEIVKEIGSRNYQRSGQRQATFFLRQRISIAIQKGNSIALNFSLRH